MKKLIFGICIAAVVSSCQTNNRKNNEEQTNQAKKEESKTDSIRITLNGIAYADAEKMVSAFRSDSMSSHKITAVWLSKAWVDTVAGLLENDGIADGFRIYFAKKTSGDNTVVIVSTRNDGADTSESKADHMDYFNHSTAFRDAILKEPIVTDYVGDAGATLFSANPNCPGSTGCSTGSIDHHISCEEAYQDILNFHKDKINTHSQWFPIKLIQRLRDELDYENVKNKQDGIRIYFAKNIEKATNQKHKNRHSFIIVTTRNGSVPRQDYYTCYTHKKDTYDNGEQCPYNCVGTTLP